MGMRFGLRHSKTERPTSSQIVPLIGRETYFHLDIRANFSAIEMYLHSYLIYGALQADKETHKTSGLVSQNTIYNIPLDRPSFYLPRGARQQQDRYYQGDYCQHQPGVPYPSWRPRRK